MRRRKRDARQRAVRLDGDALLACVLDGRALGAPVVWVQLDLVHGRRDGGDLEEGLELGLGEV